MILERVGASPCFVFEKEFKFGATMAKSDSQEQFTTKIEDLRQRLAGDLDLEELQRMQLQVDLLERTISSELDFHHHDTTEHHDHVTIAEFENVGQRISELPKESRSK